MKLTRFNVSPFSIANLYEVTWQKPALNIRDSQTTERQKKLIKDIQVIGAMTSKQILDGYYRGNKSGTEEIAQLVKKGLLRQHSLKSHLRTFAVYTTNEYIRSTDSILRALSFAQLYVKLLKVSHLSIFPKKSAPGSAAAGILEINRRPFEVIVLKGNREIIEQWAGSKHFDGRYIFITEDLKYIEPIIDELPYQQIRFATDSSLQKVPLHLAFYARMNGTFEQVIMSAFESTNSEPA